MNKLSYNDELAAEGSINTGAPVQARYSIEINAEPEKIWELLSDINRWPLWISNVSGASIDENLQPGSGFTWKSNGVQIRSIIRQSEPEKHLSWTGSVFWLHAIHTWRLEAVSQGKTRVYTAESIEGFLSRFLLPQNKLKKSLQSWLKDLKAAAEK
jgi:hypothetical protein